MMSSSMRLTHQTESGGGDGLFDLGSSPQRNRLSIGSTISGFSDDPAAEEISSDADNRLLCHAMLVARNDWTGPMKLIELGGEPLNYVDKFGKSVLHYSLRANAPYYVVEALLHRGLDANKADRDGWTPLHLFVRLHKSIDDTILTLLLSYGADPNIMNANGESPMFLAVRCGVHDSIIRKLLEAGGNPNSQNMEKETLLIYAAQTGKVSREIVAELLSCGADPWIRDLSGRNALDWGREKGQDALVKQMRKVRYEKSH